MRFAIYQGQTLHAVIESDPGMFPPEEHAKVLQGFNGASAVVPIESDTHEALLRANDSTASAIGAGVPFKGTTVSMSLQSQITILGAFMVRNSLTYPFLWSSADDGKVIEIQSAADVEALFAAATGLVFTARQAGNVAKRDALK